MTRTLPPPPPPKLSIETARRIVQLLELGKPTTGRGEGGAR